MVHEDFGRAKVFLWLVGVGDKVLVDCTASDGVIEADLPESLRSGVYGVRAMWVKDCCKRVMSEVENVFAVTDSETDVTPVNGERFVIRIKSTSATYGYDGLDAYDMSVLEGKTLLSKEDWLKQINASVKEYEELRNDLQGQIDVIVNDKAEVTLSVSPSTVFVGVDTEVTISAQTDTDASSIVIRKNDVIAEGNGGSLSVKDTISSTTRYVAEFVISGIKKSVSGTANAVNKIYYGSGSSYMDVNTSHPSPKSSAAGAYSVNVSQGGQHIFFNIPAYMSISRASMNGFDYPLESPQSVTIDGVPYKSYRSSNTNDAGTYNIVIS
jgi:hypothetical protein